MFAGEELLPGAGGGIEAKAGGAGWGGGQASASHIAPAFDDAKASGVAGIEEEE